MRGWKAFKQQEPLQPCGWMRGPKHERRNEPAAPQAESSSFVGGVATLVSLCVLLAFTNLAPTPVEMFNASQWLVYFGALMTLVGGLTLMLAGNPLPAEEGAPDDAPRSGVIAQGLAALCVYAMLATLLTWIALGAVEWRAPAAQSDVVANFINGILDRDRMQSVVVIGLLWVIVLASSALAWERFAPGRR